MPIGLTGTNWSAPLGVQAKQPPNIVQHKDAPTPNDWQNFVIGDLWLYVPDPKTKVGRTLYMLVATLFDPTVVPKRIQATWLTVYTGAGGNAITNLIDDNGNIVTPDPTTLGIIVKGGANINTDGSVPHIIKVNLNTSIWQPATSADQTQGVYGLGGNPFLHAFGTANTFLGINCGNFTLTGAANSCLGYLVCPNLSSGTANSIGGALSGSLMSSASANSIFGYNSAVALLTGTFNSFFGAYLGANYLAAESSNILIGSNITGVTGESNVLRIGNATGTADGNLANDYIAGIYNTASGVAYLGTAPKMVAIGSDDKITSSPNIYFPSTTATTGQIIQNGYCVWSDFGTNNLFIGGGGNFTMSAYASDNVGIGPNCLTHLVGTGPGDGGGNVCVGSYSGDFLTDGNGNTLIGHQTGGTYLTGITTGDNNTIVGSSTGFHYIGNESNNILIGALVNGTVGESNTLKIGNATGSSFGNINKTYICGIRTTAATPATNAMVTMVDTNDLVYALPNQTLGYVLTSNGPSQTPTWQYPGYAPTTGIVSLTGDTGSATGSSVYIAGGNNATTSASGGILTVAVSGTTNHAVQVGNASNSLTSLAVGTTGKYLRAATTANPAWSTLTLPDTVALGDVLVASATNVVGVVNNVANAGYVLTANVGAAPTFQAIPAAGVTSLNSLTGALSIVAGNNTTVTPLGTNVTVGLSGTTQYCLQVGSSVGGITDLILGTSGAVLRSAGAGANPAWSVASYPNTTVANSILVSATSNTVTASTSPSISGTYTTTAGNFAFPSTTSTSGQLVQNGGTVWHNYGTNNLFIGPSCGNFTLNTTNAIGNIGIGQHCLDSLVGTSGGQGGGNFCIGYYSGHFLTDGTGNLLWGYESGGTNTSGLTTGNNNVIIGSSSGINYTSSESNNIIFGSSNYAVTGESNVLRIGNATGTGNGNLKAAYIQGIYNKGTTATSVFISSTGQLQAPTSSRRYKENIVPLEDMGDLIKKLNPVSFSYKSDEMKSKQFGLIAEEVEPIIPEMVLYDKEGQPDSLAYQFLAPILLKEIQSLRKRIEILENK